MSLKVLIIKLLLVDYATQSLAEIHANCNDNVTLMCPDIDIDRMNFLSVSWFKLINQNRLGIIRRSKADEVTQYYKSEFNRLASFGEKYSLLIPHVMHEDSGTYECAISANVGGKNLNCRVVLAVDVCVTQAELTTMTNVLNTSHSSLLCPKQAEDLPIMWSIIGYVAVGVTKIFLCLISIWVIREVHIRSSR
ncbi:uncharacterized protein [Enoplosus armatus]|uniref:uncharacterized protein n=1 Tax=Enoplosus armatus TaxID=215367 RepID=UPI0039940EDE